jgi:hypothetical protein
LTDYELDKVKYKERGIKKEIVRGMGVKVDSSY